MKANEINNLIKELNYSPLSSSCSDLIYYECHIHFDGGAATNKLFMADSEF